MTATNKFSDRQTELSSPANDGWPITPSDTDDFSFVTRGIYIGVGGDLSVVTRDGTPLLFKNAIAGSVIPVRAKQVKAAGTTAAYLIGLV